MYNECVYKCRRHMSVRPVVVVVVIYPSVRPAVGVVSLFFCDSQVVVRGRSQAEVSAQARAEFVPTLQKNWLFWIPCNVIMFAMVPLQMQVLWMSICNLGWNTILSIYSNMRRYG